MDYFLKDIESFFFSNQTLFHLNDSKHKIKGVDRHEIIGHGHIPMSVFEKIIQLNQKKIYIVQEDPYDFEFMKKYIK